MSQLNYINYINVASAAIIGLHTLDVDLGPDYDFFNKFNMQEFSRQYEDGTMTPAEPFFLLFNIVSLFFSVFGFVQLLPAFRSSPMVQEGVSYWFGIATLGQLFAYATSGEGAERGFFANVLGFIFFSIMAGSTWKILFNQANTVSDNSAEEYWVLRFPFSLQAGWSMALAIMSVNVLFAAGEGDGDDDQVDYTGYTSSFITFLSMVAYAAMSVKLLFLNGAKPNYVVPVFISVITLGIAVNNGEAEVTWKSMLFNLTMYLISFASAVASGYLVYVNEYKSAPTLLNDDNDGAYEGAKLPLDGANNEGATMA